MEGQSSQSNDPLHNHDIRVATPRGPTPNKVRRSDFPKDFIFGAATSAYQVEGAWNEAGKGESNWDRFTADHPDKIQDKGNGRLAIDHYHQWKEDVTLIKKVGLGSYRFSIAWTRILPGGRLSAGVNREGINYYNDLINLLLGEGIIPCATIFHWDVPQCLDDEYGGFLSPRIVEDFSDFAEICFWEFGDRVKLWITLNEPWSFSVSGYALGSFAPGRGPTHEDHVTKPVHRHRCNVQDPIICSDGSPGTEPYIVAHHLILAHAVAVDIYKKNFQKLQGGKIGVTNVTAWYEPLNNTTADKEAASRAVDFSLGWFVAPVVTGDYPPVMRRLVGDRLPTFTPEQANLVKGSYDFLGINYYTTQYATNSPKTPGARPSYNTDQEVQTSTERNGTPIGEQAGSSWLFIVPEGLYKLLVHMKERYSNPNIYVTENGVDELNNKTTVAQARFDDMRVRYHHDHLVQLKKAMDHGVRVKAYYIWSMFDNFEWADGYSVRFGIIHVDFENNQLKRFPKSSAIWWTNFLNVKKVKKQDKKLFLLF
ncbi:beta-glucosidase-like isoform X1 [Olea europaea var. sylvestris]|uniref:beta-glucosidase-like isoform X1 n=1 Tax=Olea europaea var. sylvestris TaxID=158386 RepID=UPI000C1D05EE|nr:beta-glucosidase-like isoform X1 [Olea europaea var. sylvestris]